MRPFTRGDVFYMDTPIVEGSCIQGGKRPYLVLQNDIGNLHSPTTIVCPLSTKCKRLDLPTHIVIKCPPLKLSTVLCEQMRVVDVSPDWEYITTLKPCQMAWVDQAVRNVFFFKRSDDHGRCNGRS